jgi:hypothetical protein
MPLKVLLVYVLDFITYMFAFLVVGEVGLVTDSPDAVFLGCFFSDVPVREGMVQIRSRSHCSTRLYRLGCWGFYNCFSFIGPSGRFSITTYKTLTPARLRIDRIPIRRITVRAGAGYMFLLYLALLGLLFL